MNKRCDSCMWGVFVHGYQPDRDSMYVTYSNGNAGTYECHLLPPSVISVYGTNKIIAMHPPVNPDNFCSNFINCPTGE